MSLALAGCSAVRPPAGQVASVGDRLAGPPPAPALAAQLEQAIAFAERQTENLYRRLPDLEKPQDDAYPEAVLFGQKRYRMVNAAHWGSGFFPATLWALYELTGRADWKRRAESKTLGLWGEVVWDYSSNIGYKMIPFREAHRLTGDATFLSFMLRGAATYTRSFGAELCIGSIPTWNPGSRRVNGTPLGHPVHTGGLMNIELLFFAAAQPGGDRSWHQIAQRHAQNAVRDQIRPDGAVYHIVDYHPGCPPRGWRWRGTDSGNPEGIKARPQALAIHGLTAAYTHTKDRALLEAAVRAASYFIDHAPADGVPYTDLTFGPVSTEARESSAAAIAASALLDLATLPAVGASDRQRFRAAAERLLGSLATHYLARGQDEGILGRGSEPLKPRLTPGASQPIGDHAFLDAIRKYLGPGMTCRAPVCELEAEAGRLNGARATTTPPLAVEKTATARSASTVLVVRLPRPGRYRFRARMQVADRPARLRVNLGPDRPRTWNVSATRGFQDVAMAEPFDLSAGQHPLAISEIPAGVQIDKLVLERQPEQP